MPDAPSLEWNDSVIRGTYGDFRYRAQVVEQKDGTYRWGASAGLPANPPPGGAVQRATGNHVAQGRCDTQAEGVARCESSLQLLIALARVEREPDSQIARVNIEWR